MVPSKSHPKKKQNPSSPLLNPRHEAFAVAVARGMKLLDAYKAAGFEGRTHASAWKLRHSPDVDARVIGIANERVKADSRAFVRRQKMKGDLLDSAIKRLANIAFTDIREVATWREEPTLNAEGEVIGSQQRLRVRDALDLTPEAAALIRSAFTKSGEVRIETHDQRTALVDLVKLLKGDDAMQPSNVNIQQVNIGGTDALEAAKRVSFLLAAARSREPREAVQISRLVDVT